MLDAKRKVVQEKIFQSGPISYDDCGQSGFWNSVRKETVSDLIKERKSNKFTDAPNRSELTKSKPDIVTSKLVSNKEKTSVTVKLNLSWFPQRKSDGPPNLNGGNPNKTDSKTTGVKKNEDKVPLRSSQSDKGGGNNAGLTKKHISLSVPTVKLTPTSKPKPPIRIPIAVKPAMLTRPTAKKSPVTPPVVEPLVLKRVKDAAFAVVSPPVTKPPAATTPPSVTTSIIFPSASAVAPLIGKSSVEKAIKIPKVGTTPQIQKTCAAGVSFLSAPPAVPQVDKPSTPANFNFTRDGSSITITRINMEHTVAPTPLSKAIAPSVRLPAVPSPVVTVTPIAVAAKVVKPPVIPAHADKDDEIEILPTPPKPTPAVITLSDDESNSASSPARKRLKQARPNRRDQSVYDNEDDGVWSLTPDEVIGRSRHPDTRSTVATVTPAPTPAERYTYRNLPSISRHRTIHPEKRKLTSRDLAPFSTAFASPCRNELVYKCLECCAFYTILARYYVHVDLHNDNSKGNVWNCHKCGWRMKKHKKKKHLQYAHASPPQTPNPEQHQSVSPGPAFGEFTSNSKAFEVRSILSEDVKSFPPSVEGRLEGKVIYKCKLCPRLFLSEVEFNVGRHSQLHWSGDGVSCEWCGWLLNRCEVEAHDREWHEVMSSQLCHH